MEGQSEATFLFLKVSGDEAVATASEVLSKMIGSVTAAPSVAEQSPAVELPATERMNVAAIPYEKPEGEPDGFRGPEPAPSRAIAVDRGGRGPGRGNRLAEKPKTRTKAGSDRAPGALASKIIKILDSGTGVAPLEHLINERGSSAQGVNVAITKCPQLQRLGDGRIALAGYRDED